MMRTDLEDDIVGDQSASPENGNEDRGLDVQGIHAYLRWLLLSGLVCFGFAAVASIVISLQLWLMEYPEEGLVFRLFAKGLFFAVAFGACALLTYRSRGNVKPPPEKSASPETVPWKLYVAVGALVLAVTFPMLHEYPWTAPDELHHLVVARNLSEHSAYASGNPEAGFTYFDHIDSVGPTVLGPLALAFEVFWPTITAARVVMGTFFLGLAFGIFVLVRDSWGRREAALSVAITTLSFGTIYLARSLYGEVPALMFLVWSMVCWGKSFHSERGNALAFVSGALWAFGILAKSILFLSAFPIVGVWLYDRLTTKQISAKRILVPAAGGLAVLGAWSAITAYYDYLITEEISMIFFYRHYLMFGLPSSWSGLEWFADQPIYSLSLLAVVMYAIPQLFERIPNPAPRVLLLSGELYLFWWIFYTPASIPRYMWYSYALVGIFSGPFVLRGFKIVRDAAFSPRRRLGFLIAGACVLISCGLRLAEQIDLIYLQDEAADERHLAEYLRSLPEDTQIASDYWLVGLSIDFMTGRNIHGIEDSSVIDDQYEVIIYNVDFHVADAEMLEDAHRIGRYAIVHAD